MIKRTNEVKTKQIHDLELSQSNDSLEEKSIVKDSKTKTFMTSSNQYFFKAKILMSISLLSILETIDASQLLDK